MYFSSTLGIDRSSVKLQLIVFVIIVEQRAVGGSRGRQGGDTWFNFRSGSCPQQTSKPMLVWTQIHSHSWDKYIHSLDTNTFRLLRQSLEPGATQKGRVQNIYGSKNTLNEVSLEWTSCWSRKYIHTFETNTLNLWRQIQRLLVEALESGADPVGAWDRFSEHWPTSEWPACTLKSCHNWIIFYLAELKKTKVFCVEFYSDCPAINGGLGCHVADSHSFSATPRISIVFFRSTFLKCFVPR